MAGKLTEPLKPSARAEACRLLSEAYELAQMALLQGNSGDQADRWRAVASAARVAEWTCVEAVREALGPPKRGNRHAHPTGEQKAIRQGVEADPRGDP